MFKVWCEWDYGQEDAVFTTRDKALIFIDAIVVRYNDDLVFSEDRFLDGQALIDDGLAGVIELDVDPE